MGMAGAAGGAIVLHPPAKLNLTLEVLGRRPDGYHELATVLQAIDLRDTLEVRPSAELALSCSSPGLAGEANLAWRAARLLRERAGVRAGAALRLTKRIPIAAGLGGGSADAAAALLGLGRLWCLDWPRERLAALAAELGSDVPFFLGSATALASGRGEAVSPLPALPPLWALVVRPAAGAPPGKTQRLYAALGPEDYRDGRASRSLAAALATGAAVTPSLLVNSFARPARAVFPGLAAAEEAMRAAGAPWVRLTGSGPCLYTLLSTAEAGRAAAIAGALRAAGREAYLARVVAGAALPEP